MNFWSRRTVVLAVAVATLSVALAAQSQSVPEEWKSLDVQGLTDLAEEFRAKGNAGVKDRERLAAYVSERYAAAKAGGSVDWNEWLDLVVVLGRKFPADVKTAMSRDLQAALAPDQAAIVALPAETLLKLGPALARLGAVAKACDVHTTWIVGSEKHRAIDHAQTARLTSMFRGAGEERKEARLRLIRFLKDTYLADSEKTRRLTCAQWREFTWVLRPDLSEEARRGWAERIRQAYAGTTDQLLQLDGDRFIHLARALWSHLGDKKTVELAARWLEKTENWRPLKDAQSLKLLVNLTQRTGQAGKAARTRLAEHVTKTCLSDPEAVRSAALGDWKGLAASLSEDLSAEARARWVTGLRSAYVNDTEVFRALRTQECLTLTGLLKALGDREAPGVVPAWFERSTAWQSVVPRELVSLARGLLRSGGAGKAARARLIEHVSATCLAGEEATRSVSPGQWRDLVGALTGDLSAEARGRWLKGLRKAYAGPKGLDPLKVGGVLALASALNGLGDKEAHATVVVSWVQRKVDSPDIKPAELVSLAASLSGPRMGRVCKPARLRLAEHITGTYLADAVSAKRVSCVEWEGLARALEKDLSAEKRARWAEQLRAAHADGPDAMGRLKAEQAVHLGKSLASLGHKQVPSLVSAWMQKNTGWRSLKLDGLTWLAANLQATDGATKALRASLGQHITATCLSDAKAVRSAGLGGWNALVARLGKDLPAEGRAAWVAGLRAAYVEDAEVLGSMSLKNVRGLSSVLNALGDKRAHRVVLEWLGKTETWRSYALKDLSSLAASLSETGEAGKVPRLGLAEHVTTKYLADLKAARSAGVAGWKGLAEHLTKELPAEVKTIWIAQVRSLFVGDAEVFGRLGLGEVQELSSALTALGDGRAGGLANAWTERTARWQALEPPALVALAKGLSKLGKAGKPSRVRVAAHVEERYLGSSSATRSVPCGEWQGLAQALARDLSAERRAMWVSKLRGVFGASTALTALKVNEIQALAGALAVLGDEQAQGLLAKWTEETTRWQALEPPALVALAKGLSKAGEEGKAARQRLVEHITANYLKDRAATVSVSCGAWKGLALNLGKEVSPERRAAWADRLLSAYTDSQGTLRGLKFVEVRDLAEALGALGGMTQLVTLVDRGAAAQSWKPQDASTLAGILSRYGKEGTRARQRLGEYVAAAYLTDEAATRTVECTTWRGLVGCLNKDLSPEARALWVSRLRAAFADDTATLRLLKPSDFRSLIDALKALGDTKSSSLVAKWAVRN